jgi:hypothetical protein
MNLVLSLQKLSSGAADFVALDSSNSGTCSSESTGGCTIVKTGQMF